VAGAGVSSARVRVLVLTVLGVALLAAAGWGTRTLLASAQSPAAADGAGLCDQYTLLMATLDGSSAFGTQAGNHAARKLSDLASPSSDPSVALAGGDIATVMASVAWEVSDLVTATRPIAVACGWDWPIGSAPPSVRPEPPST
jgi:hypothetical protein